MFQLTVREDLSEVIQYTSRNIPVYSLASRLHWFKNHTASCHWHEDLEFTVITEGTMSYFVNGLTYQLSKGMGIFVNSNRLHFGGPGADPVHDCRFTCLLLHPSLLRSTPYIESRFVDPFLYDAGRDAFVLSPETAWQRRALSCITSLTRMVREQPPGYELCLQSRFYFLWSLFYTNIRPEEGLPPHRSELMRGLKEMTGFIHAHYAEKITLDDIAASGMMCRSKCCRLFRQNLHQTAIEYLLHFRIRKSLDLLAETGLSITEISGSCGFNGASYYTEVFGKIMGTSPRNYREKNRKNSIYPSSPRSKGVS
jgi:AraC-like DNA-binding protein